MLIVKFIRTSYKFIVFLILLLGFNELYAQYQIPFINYTTKNGLVQTQINDICQDHRGYIWLATAGGICRFDGKNFKNYSVSDGLPANTVTALLVDRENRLWIAMQGGGLSVYDGKVFRTYDVKDGLVSNNIASREFSRVILEDSKGNIWCRTEEGVSVIEGGNVKTYNKNSGLAGNNITCLSEDRQGRMICGTENNISIIEDGKISNCNISASFGMVISILTNNNGEIWIAGTNNHIAQFVGNRFIEYSLPRQANIITANFDSQGRLWVATVESGIYVYEKNEFRQLGQLTDPVTRIFEDSQRNIWLLALNDGVYKFDNRKLHHYSESLGLVGSQTKCIFEDIEGNVWIGTDNGISMYGKVIFETLTTESGLPNNHIISVAADSSGNIWCGPQTGGLIRFNDSRMDIFESQEKNKNPRTNLFLSIEAANNKILLGTFSEGIGYFLNGKIFPNILKLSNTDISDIIDIGDDEYWAATSHGLMHVRNGKAIFYDTEDGLIDDYIYFLAKDSKGRIWCTTDLGLSVFDGQQFVSYTIENGLPNNTCTDITIDKYGAIWLGTENGLCKITETGGILTFKVYTINDGLASNSINLVHADQNDKLWIGYINGLNTIDLKTGDIRYYAEEDGYLPMDCYRGAATTDVYGNVWFGTVAGLVKYNPKADTKRITPPQTYVTNISLSDGEDIMQYADSISSKTGLPQGLSLPHNKNTVRIDWIGIHFTVPTKNRYQFILEGYEKTWHEESLETFREYQLSPGHYTFKVIACNNDGVWNTDPVSYSFVVRPPWWATIVAYITYAVILMILVILYVRWRERSLIEKNRILEEKVYERTIEIELQKQNIIEINKDLELYQDELIKQRDMAATQRDQIAEQRMEILDSIHYAKRIQTAIMPKPELMAEILPEYFLFFRPRDVVSGDYYWAAKQGKRSVVVAADCTGHGVPGAFMSMLGISILNEIVLKQEEDKAAEILNELRSNLKWMLSQTGAAGEQRDGMDMALCIINYDAMELQYAGAYNSLYLIRNGELFEYKADKMPVGIHIGVEKEFTNHTIELQHNDMLYVFSDGYVDQFGGPDDCKFKSKPFKQLLTSLSILPVEQQKEKLIEIHDAWKGDNHQIDDILVIGIRIG